MLLLLPGLVLAQETLSCQQFKRLRYDEDHRGSEPAAACRFKQLKLAGHDLAIGGEWRTAFEYSRSPAFGQDAEDRHGAVLQRFTVHGDWRGEHARLFAQAYSALAWGRADGPSPVDENRLTWQNLFAELQLPVAAAQARLRAGRQELSFGSGRLIDVREGTNVRRTFHAIRLDFLPSDGLLTLLLARPLRPMPGSADDEADDDRLLSGFLATGMAAGPVGALDVYYLHSSDKAPMHVDARLGQERRRTAGLRVFGRRAGQDWNVEAGWQSGSTDQGAINAWLLSLDAGHTWMQHRHQPRLGLAMTWASGDRDADDGKLQTWNPLFPRGSYLTQDALLGPRNLLHVQPAVSWQTAPGLRLSMELNSFWRVSVEDGIYRPGGRVFRAPEGGAARHVATSVAGSIGWVPAPRWLATMNVVLLQPGEFIRDSGEGERTLALEALVRFRF